MLPIELHYRRQILDERTAAKYDAVLAVCAARNAAKLLKQFPHASLWRKLQALTHVDGATPALHARLPNSAVTAMTVGFAQDTAAPFSCLSLAGKLVKESKLSSHCRVLLVVIGFDAEQAIRLQEALLAATLASSAPLPNFKAKQTQSRLQTITLLHAGAKPDHASTLATHAGNHLARWLTTLPPNHLDCVSYASALKTLARRMRWQYQFLGEPQLKQAGAGAFLAVARANAQRGAGIVKLSYRPKAKTHKHIALVGKGICFDTGGINLKSHKSMYQMHEDMQGSAVAVGTLLALTQLKAPIAIDCWLALTENEIGPKAYRPQEVVTAANGVTIQVAHSDAEGRMVLADTLALASRAQPDVILDFATLTGACVGALTERMSGVFTNRSEWRTQLENAGRDSGERVWNFPMDEDYDSDLDSQVADILQCTPDSKGDHILAARFLSRFVAKDIGWVHVDLSSSNRPGGLGHIPSDCTGFGVRFAVAWLLSKERDS
jgi:leucyl aminopeptidase